MTISRIRDWWDRSPCNINHSPVTMDEDPELFSELVTKRKYFIEPHIPGFAQFDQWKGKRVLELGCGIGTDTLAFAHAGACITAVDISHESVRVARARAEAEGLGEKINLLVGNIEQGGWPVPPGGYDLVYSFGVLHHTPAPENALIHMCQSLSAGGELRIMLYNRYSWKVLRLLLRYWRPGMSVDDAVARKSEAQGKCPLTRTYTRRMATEMLSDCGFGTIDISMDHIFPYRVSDYIKHKHVLEWYWDIMPAWLFRSLERRMGWHLLITARKGA